MTDSSTFKASDGGGMPMSQRIGECRSASASIRRDALGPGHYEGYYDAARYVDKILRGADPAELPIAEPTQFTLSVSRTALARLGLSLPPDLSARVNEWVD